MKTHVKTKSKGIVAWPEGERPRERLLRMGAQTLTDAELVAILLRVGVHGTSAVELGRQILKKFGSLLEDALLAVGAVDKARPPIRLIVARTLQANASAVILAHNHPSGAAEASESDRLFTEDVYRALKPIGVKVLDHLIIGTDSVCSFSDSGLLDEIALANGI